MPGAESLVRFHVTGAAEGDEVRPLARAAVGKGNDVMYLLGGFDDAVLLAFLAQRVLPYLAVTDSFPRSAVGVLVIRSQVLVVELFCLCFMLGTVLFSLCGKAGAAGVSAWPVWFLWRDVHLLEGKGKALRDFSLKALFILFR